MFSRNGLHRLYSAPSIDLTKFVRVGDLMQLKKSVTKLQTTNRTGLPGDEVLSTARLIQQIEIQSANMVESSLDRRHYTVGEYVELDHKHSAYLGDEINISTEIIDVKKDKATFKTIVTLPVSNVVIGEGFHTRKLVAFD